MKEGPYFCDMAAAMWMKLDSHNGEEDGWRTYIFICKRFMTRVVNDTLK
jgi:hypothetical protein